MHLVVSCSYLSGSDSMILSVSYQHYLFTEVTPMSWLAYVHCMDILLSKSVSYIRTTRFNYYTVQALAIWQWSHHQFLRHVILLALNMNEGASGRHDGREERGANDLLGCMWEQLCGWCREDESATSRSAATWSHLHCWEVWAGQSHSQRERGDSQQHCRGSAHRKGHSACCGKKKNFRKQFKKKMYGVESLFQKLNIEVCIVMPDFRSFSIT